MLCKAEGDTPKTAKQQHWRYIAPKYQQLRYRQHDARTCMAATYNRAFLIRMPDAVPLETSINQALKGCEGQCCQSTELLARTRASTQ